MRALIVASAATATLTFAGAAQASDWTGFYLGGQIGNSDSDIGGVALNGKSTWGLHGGYMHQFGQTVVGGELEWDRSRLELAGVGTGTDTMRVKAKVGYDFGPALGYATAGWVKANTTAANDNGYFFGVGAAYKISQQVSLSGELTHNRFSDFAGSGATVKANTMRAGLSYHF